MIFDVFVLEEAKLRLQAEASECRDRSKELMQRLDRAQAEDKDLEERLKKAAGLAHGDAEALVGKATAARNMVESLVKQLRSNDLQTAAAEWTLQEANAEIDRIFVEFKTMFGPVLLRKADPNAAAASESEGATGSDSARESAKAKKLSQAKQVSSFREAISKIIEHLQEIGSVNSLRLVVFDSLAEEVPHFSSWEQRVQSNAFAAKEKIERVQRYLCNVVNAVASTFPDFPNDVSRWNLFVSWIDDAMRRLILRAVRTSFLQYRRCFEGKASRELFAINLKLGANCRAAFSPAATDVTSMTMTALSKVASIGSDRYLGEILSHPATPPAKIVHLLDGVGSDVFYKSHVDYVNADDEVVSAFAAIRTATARYADDIVAFVVDVEQKFELLWSPEMTAMTETQLKDSLRQLEYWNPRYSLKRGLLINAFPLQDAVISMCVTQLSRLRKKASEDAVNPDLVQKALMQRSTLKGAITTTLFSGTAAAKPIQPAASKAAVAPLSRGEVEKLKSDREKPAAPKEQAPAKEKGKEPEEKRQETPRATLPPASKKENEVPPAATAAPVKRASAPTATSATDGPTQQPTRLTPRQLNVANNASANHSASSSKESSPSSNATPASETSPAPASGAMKPLKLTTPGTGTAAGQGATRDPPPPIAGDSPRPSTTPVGTRSRSGPQPAVSSQPREQSQTPQKYNGPASLKAEGGVYSRVVAASGNSPTAQQPPSAMSAEIPRDTVGQDRRSPDANTVPPVATLNSAQRRNMAWGTPTKSAENSPQRDHGPYSMGGGSHHTGTEQDDLLLSQQMALHKSLQRDQEALARVRQLKEKEEQRLRQLAQEEAEAAEEKSSSRKRFVEEKSRQETEERQRASSIAREKQRRDEEEQRRQEEDASKEKQRRDKEEAERRAMIETIRQEEAARKQKELDARLEAEMQRRADEQKKLQEARRREIEEQQRREEAQQRQAAEQLQKLEREREEAERLQREELEKHQLRIKKLNEETSALRKKLQLPPVQPPLHRAPAEPDSPSPAKARPTPQQAPTSLPPTVPQSGSNSLGSSFQSGNPDSPSRRPPAGTTPQSHYTLMQRPPSSGGKPLALTPLPFEDDGVERSLLDEYKRCCAAANIKPNSGLLKRLPREIGEHVEEINLDLNYIGIKGVQPLIHILKRNRGLRLLNLKDNNLENNEIRQLVAVLMTESGACLETLDLSNNPISLAGGSALLDLVLAQKSLTNVFIRGTLIQPKVVERIVEAAKANAGQ